MAFWSWEQGNGGEGEGGAVNTLNLSLVWA